MNLNINEFLKLLGVKKPTNKIKKHPKVLQILNYCNQNDKDLYEHNFSIKEESLIILIENIHSTETLLQILTNVSVLLNLDEYPLQLATFYNLYNPQILTYSEYSDILIDEEYLKYATKEWTENNLMTNNKILNITNNKITLKDNPNDPFDENYIEEYLLNLVELKKAKELNLLKEAIEKLS